MPETEHVFTITLKSGTTRTIGVEAPTRREAFRRLYGHCITTPKGKKLAAQAATIL